MGKKVYNIIVKVRKVGKNMEKDFDTLFISLYSKVIKLAHDMNTEVYIDSQKCDDADRITCAKLYQKNKDLQRIFELLEDFVEENELEDVL